MEMLSAPAVSTLRNHWILMGLVGITACGER